MNRLARFKTDDLSRLPPYFDATSKKANGFISQCGLLTEPACRLFLIAYFPCSFSHSCGLWPVAFLKARLKVALLLKPQS